MQAPSPFQPAPDITTQSCIVPLIIALFAFHLPSVSGCNHEPPLPGNRANSITVLLDDTPRNLDPRFATDATSMRVSRLIFSSLITVDNQELKPTPQLAASLPQADSEKPHVWTVHLRPNVTWHDGKPVTADDVVYTYQSVMDPEVGSPLREPFQAHIKQVEALGPLQVKFTLNEPYATFVTDLVLGIVPRHLCEPHGGRFPDGNYVGSGPFRFVRRVGDRRIDLARNSRAFDGTPHVEHVVLRTIRDEGTRLTSLLAGSGDLMQNGVSPVLTSVLQDSGRLSVTKSPSISFTYVALNLRNAALADVRVRRALAYAINRQRIIETHLHGGAELATGMLLKRIFPEAVADDARRYGYEPERARRLLAEAGYGPGGKSLDLIIKISTNRFRRTIARAIAQAWREVGVNTTVRSYEFGTFFSDIKAGNFQTYLLDVPEPSEPDMYRWMLHGLGTPWKKPAATGSRYATADRRYLSPGALKNPAVAADPSCRTWQWLALKTGTRNWVMRSFGQDPPYYTANRMSYYNPLVDCRLDLGVRTIGMEARGPLYREVHRLVARELPVIPLWHQQTTVVMSERLSGYTALPNMRLDGLRNVRIQSGGSR
jgi:peptide/nickel transport system substrate-binding protein